MDERRLKDATPVLGLPLLPEFCHPSHALQPPGKKRALGSALESECRVRSCLSSLASVP